MKDLNYKALSLLSYEDATLSSTQFQKSNRTLKCHSRSFKPGPETIVTKVNNFKY